MLPFLRTNNKLCMNVKCHLGFFLVWLELEHWPLLNTCLYAGHRKWAWMQRCIFRSFSFLLCSHVYFGWSIALLSPTSAIVYIYAWIRRYASTRSCLYRFLSLSPKWTWGYILWVWWWLLWMWCRLWMFRFHQWMCW